MNISVDELHNHEDVTSLTDGLMFFFWLIMLLGIVGLVFWSAF